MPMIQNDDYMTNINREFRPLILSSALYKNSWKLGGK